MMRLKKIGACCARSVRLGLAGIFWASSLFAPQAEAAGLCSSSIGKATLNEYANQANYVEVRQLDPSVSFANWKVRIYSSAGSFATKALPASGASLCGNYQVLTFRNNETPVDSNIVLLDASDNVVDILRVSTSGTATAFYTKPSCNYVGPSTDLTGVGNSQKGIDRLPDGTGKWRATPGSGAGSYVTQCAANQADLTPSSALDLALTKTVTGSSSISVGGSVTFRLSIKNNGPATAVNLQVADTLPSGLTYVSNTAPSAGSFNSTTMLWDITSLASGVTATLDITVQGNSVGSWTNSASAASDNTDTVSSNNTATAGVAVGLSGPHHLAIDHPASGLTCQPSSVTVKACADAACSSLYAGGVTANLSPGGQAVSIGASGIATGSIVQTTAANVTLSANTIVPAPANALVCNNTVTGASDCAMVFNDSGFLVTAANHLACSNQAVTIQAVQKSATSTACVTSFANKQRSINLYSSYISPNTGTKQANVTYNTSQVISALATAAPGSSLTNLNFDGTGTATVTLSYPDVGQVQLNASYTGSAGTGDSGLSMTGAGTFIAAPAAFLLSNPPSSYVAAKSFAVDLTALTTTGNACASATAAANFGKEGETVALLNATRLTPTGTANALSGPSDGAFTSGVAGSFSSGKTTLTGNAWTEAGTLQVTARVSDGDYLGSGLNGSTNLSFGPFIPAYFDTELTPGCTAFSYSGQPLTAKVTAKNLAGGTTLNYSYLSGVGMAKNVTLSNAGSASNLINNALAPSDFAAGIGTKNNFTYTLPASPGAPVNLSLRAVDTDGVTSSGHTEGATAIRQGRARLLNAHGSELLDLPMTFRTEYWTGAMWTKNTDDTCTGNTALNAANGVSMALANGSLMASKTCILDTGTPGRSGAGCVTATSAKQFIKGATPSVGFAGDFNLWLKGSGSGNQGSVLVNATVPAWLQFNWTGSVGSPSAIATFGLYQSGAGRVIHQRELY